MAIQLTIPVVPGIDAPSAYGRVISWSYAVPPEGIEQELLQVAIAFYVSATARRNKEEPFVVRILSVPVDFTKNQPTNLKTLIYNYMKSLPSYAGAVDA